MNPPATRSVPPPGPVLLNAFDDAHEALLTALEAMDGTYDTDDLHQCLDDLYECRTHLRPPPTAAPPESAPVPSTKPEVPPATSRICDLCHTDQTPLGQGLDNINDRRGDSLGLFCACCYPAVLHSVDQSPQSYGPWSRATARRSILQRARAAFAKARPPESAAVSSRAPNARPRS